MLRELLETLGPQVSDSQHPGGAGYLIHGGFILKCYGTAGVDDEGEPIRENRHVIGTFSGGPDDVYPIPHPDMPDSNPEVNDGIFTLDPAQEGLDPSAPVCMVCGQPINLKL